MKCIPTKYIIVFSFAILSLAISLSFSQAKPDIKVKAIEMTAPSSGAIPSLERKLESLVAQIENSNGTVRNVSVLNSRHPDKILCVITYEAK